MVMRTVQEIEAQSKSPEFQPDFDDNPEIRNQCPEGISDADFAFIFCACEDCPDDWAKLFEACVGKSRAEMAKIAYAATSEAAA